jgi:hypothetical protein
VSERHYRRRSRDGCMGTTRTIKSRRAQRDFRGRRSSLRYLLVEYGRQGRCVELTAEHCFVLERGRGSYLASALPIMDFDDFQFGVKDQDGLRASIKIWCPQGNSDTFAVRPEREEVEVKSGHLSGESRN